MLILLLPATFLVVFLLLNGFHASRQTPLADWRLSFLQSATFLGGYMVLFSELLSLFKALTSLWVAISWGLALLFSLILGWKTGWIKEGYLSLRNQWTKPGWFDILAGAIVAFILILLFIVAVKSPVNNNDSLLYHMSRVMHWTQNKSLSHFATGYEHQLYNPIFAELAILHSRLLINSDKLANMTQWLALTGSLIGISRITSLLGGKKVGRWVAVAFAISIPMALLQATNPQNDLVTAFWLICLLNFIFINGLREITKIEIVSLALALGLGLLTKGTFYVYAITPMVYFLIVQFRSTSLKKTGINLLFIGLVAFMLNVGYWARNFLTFNTPLGSRQFISNHTADLFTPGRILGGITLAITQNFATPSDPLNNKITSMINVFLNPLDPSANDFILVWAWNHEDFAGNPVQISLLAIVITVLVIFRKRLRVIASHYLYVILGMFFMLVTVVYYGIFGIRFQMPILLAFSPLVGLVVELPQKKYFSCFVTIILLLSAFPWVLFNRTRPLIAMRDSNDPYTIPCLAGCTTGSILIEPPEKTMFAVWGSLGSAYVDAMNQVKETGCRNIGLKLDSNDLEYAYWYLLGAPQNGMRLDSIVTYPELERYLDPSFKPCVIICTTCGEQTQLFGLDRVGSYGDGRIKIFSGDGYNPKLP